MSDSVQVAIGIHDGKIKAQWSEPQEFIVFEAKNAFLIGIELARLSLELNHGKRMDGDLDKIYGELAEIMFREKVKGFVDLRKDGIVGSVSTILRTAINQKRSEGYMALHCVEAVIKGLDL